MSFAARELMDEALLVRLRARSTWLGLGCVLHAWAIILASAAVLVLLPLWARVLTYPLIVAIIGSRQLGLAVLMHEGAHGGLARAPRLNMFVSQWFCGFPVGVDTRRYRDYHLHHHAHAQTRRDPDLVLSAPFPVTPASLRRKLLRDLTGQTGLKQRRAQIRAAMGDASLPWRARLARFWANLGGTIIANLVLLAASIAAGAWWLYPLAWLVPLLTWQQAVTRVRNIAEHAVLPVEGDQMAVARTTLTGPVGRFFLAPYWVNYHAEHHLLMYIPCYRLKAMHQAMMAGPHAARLEVRHGYREVLRLATAPNGRRQGGAAQYAGMVPL